MLYNPVTVERTIAGKKIIIETGRMAKQAAGAALITCGGTTVLTTVCYKPLDASSGIDFFPLTVNYVEKYYAAGKFPGGFFKREAKISDRETLIARLTDRPMRPLFPKTFKAEVQIVSTVISADGENPPDVLSMIGASAAVSLSEIPFNGPIGAVKIGRVNGEYIINPNAEKFENSDFEIALSGTKDAIMMVEGSAKIVPEEDLIKALEYGHSLIKEIVILQDEIVAKCGKTKLPTPASIIPADVEAEVRAMLMPILPGALFIKEKQLRADALYSALKSVEEKFSDKIAAQPMFKDFIHAIFEHVEYDVLRQAILNENKRLDGRKLDQVRPIQSEVSILQSTHGSALFTRGETQSLGIVTLGSNQDMQGYDSIEGEGDERFMLHYNFPPFSVGEVKRMGAPGRREIGHGFLAKRALEAVIPSYEEFPYAIRVVSEILESNGSSSQASICAGCLSLMDAGVPIKEVVAGIAMGLIKDGDNFKIVSDIIGAEDHLGDMDFKVGGTEKGVTAVQMDIKILGVTFEIMKTAFAQAREGRIHIINEMKKCMSAPRPELSPRAPKVTQMQIDPDKIRDLIGPGGKMIKSITERTGIKLDVDDKGMVRIAGSNQEKVKEAIQLIKAAIKDLDVGAVYDGVVVRVENFGAFVEIFPGCDGLVHVSELAQGFVKNPSDVVKIGQEVKVRLFEIDRQGRLNLSIKRV